MRSALAALAVGVAFACNEKTRAPPDAGAQAPDVSAGVQLIRDADAALQAGKFDLAIEKATAALKLEPGHPLASNVLGRALMLRLEKEHQAADAVAARAAFERALEANPQFWPALENLGELAETQGQGVEAAAYYRKLLEAQPRHPARARYEKIIAAAVDAGE